MARNEEKAQSMLYRFREAKAAELGIAGRGDKRPRLASSCKSLRDCERWRGEILREISRKVSKIHDMGLSDYEIRDLNDEINKLMREKRHWENQIIALGGANYKRNIAMLDSEGKEVPGTKGYKYFGRAKDLPGVKELFEKKTEIDEESQAAQHYRKYQNQGPAYYGDLDEGNEALLAYEIEAEEEDWEDSYASLAKTLGLGPDYPIPPIPRPAPISLSSIMSPSSATVSTSDSATTREKRKKVLENVDADADVEMGDENEEQSKRTKTDGPASSSTRDGEAAISAPVNQLPPLLSVFQPSDLAPPVLPTREVLEKVLLDLRKRALLEEYVGDGTLAS